MMKKIFIIFLFACNTFFIPQNTYSQKSWRLKDGFASQNGKQVFLHGANYVVSKNWLLNLEIWNEAAYENDMKMLSELGVNCLRYFPLWSLVQPEPNKLDKAILKRLERIVELAEKYHISLQLAPLTGFVSGHVFVPKWATDGNLFTNPELIKAEQFLVRGLAKRYRDNPNVQVFDFGNEINVLLSSKMKLNASEKQIDDWMQAIYKAFKEGVDLPVTNGIGTGYPNLWKVGNMKKSVDFMSTHYQCAGHAVDLKGGSPDGAVMTGIR